MIRGKQSVFFEGWTNAFQHRPTNHLDPLTILSGSENVPWSISELLLFDEDKVRVLLRDVVCMIRLVLEVGSNPTLLLEKDLHGISRLCYDDHGDVIGINVFVFTPFDMVIERIAQGDNVKSVQGFYESILLHGLCTPELVVPFQKYPMFTRRDTAEIFEVQRRSIVNDDPVVHMVFKKGITVVNWLKRKCGQLIWITVGGQGPQTKRLCFVGEGNQGELNGGTSRTLDACGNPDQFLFHDSCPFSGLVVQARVEFSHGPSTLLMHFKSGFFDHFWVVTQALDLS